MWFRVADQASQAIEFYADGSGHAIDTSGQVFATSDGVTWEPIGIEDADVTFYGLDSDAADDVFVCGGNATVFEYAGVEWIPESLGDARLDDIETDSDTGIAVGGGGAIFEFMDEKWTRATTPTGENLKGVARGERDLAVGASAVVLAK